MKIINIRKTAMLKVLFSLTLAVILSSCSEKEDQIIGKWDDNIKLSLKSAEFSAKADSITIKMEGDGWWINEISVNDSSYQFYGNDDVDMESESYTITEDLFVVERSDKNTLFVKMENNDSGTERTMTIVLQAGDYFDYVNLKQLAE